VLVTQMLPRFAVVPASLVLSVGVTAVSYRYLERPFVKLKERFQYVRSQPLLKKAA
jgi:peptidoglycan/LPS O-acetylase OafA/YrhL